MPSESKVDSADQYQVDEEEEEEDDVQEMVKLLTDLDFILALQTDDKLIYGSKATKKEKKVLLEKIKKERKAATPAAKT